MRLTVKPSTVAHRGHCQSVCALSLKSLLSAGQRQKWLLKLLVFLTFYCIHYTLFKSPAGSVETGTAPAFLPRPILTRLDLMPDFMELFLWNRTDTRQQPLITTHEWQLQCDHPLFHSPIPFLHVSLQPCLPNRNLTWQSTLNTTQYSFISSIHPSSERLFSTGSQGSLDPTTIGHKEGGALDVIPVLCRSLSWYSLCLVVMLGSLFVYETLEAPSYLQSHQGISCRCQSPSLWDLLCCQSGGEREREFLFMSITGIGKITHTHSPITTISHTHMICSIILSHCSQFVPLPCA